MEKNKPKILADSFIKYDDEEEPENFTNFQELMARVSILTDTVDELAEILRENNLTRTKIIEAEYFDMERVYNMLEEDNG